MLRIFFLSLALFTLVTAGAAPVRYVDADARAGTSKATVVDPVPLAHTALILPLNAKGEVVGQGDVRKQAEQVLKELDKVLKRAKSGLRETVKLNVYVARAELSATVSEVLAKRFSGKQKPAVTFVGGDMVRPDVLVAMDGVAVSTAKTVAGEAVHFATKESRFSEVSILPPHGAVYVAGLAERGELGAATKATLEKIDSAIAHLGLKGSNIVQLKAFLLPMSDISKVKAAIAEHYQEGIVPAVVYVDWMSGSVPIEIEAIAAAPASSSEKTITYHTPDGITASPVYSRLARVHSGKRIYISGLQGGGTPENDVNDIYKELDDLIEKTGSSRDHLAKATYYYSDPKSNSRLDAFRPKYYTPTTPPTASKVRVKDVGSPGRGIVIDMIGVTK